LFDIQKESWYGIVPI